LLKAIDSFTGRGPRSLYSAAAPISEDTPPPTVVCSEDCSRAVDADGLIRTA
jgi:hypothetical protein